ncbi:hypothetical protein M378DRAFT_357519 [Amanita muscaria Koide BX008]|uniref:Uncharacterized protein n=1 Tax=Amanita muscaria (strain Koide BX008) TaxID=946122 RepID=A0A0C2W9K9_AMAMK|nr:hypothetical protein M378DRAFT_357519 [Amanita muscaria Koide BX008]
MDLIEKTLSRRTVAVDSKLPQIDFRSKRRRGRGPSHVNIVTAWQLHLPRSKLGDNVLALIMKRPANEVLLYSSDQLFKHLEIFGQKKIKRIRKNHILEYS